MVLDNFDVSCHDHVFLPQSGFVFIGIGLLITSIPLFFFPRKLPATLRREAKRMIRQAEKDEKAGGNRGVEYFLALAKTKKKEAKPTLKSEFCIGYLRYLQKYIVSKGNHTAYFRV